MKKCELCKSTMRVEEHHEIPRSCGGHDSKLHPLCVTCHDFIHDVAVAILGKARRHLVDFLISAWASEQLTRVEDKDASIRKAKDLISKIVHAYEKSKLDSELINNPQMVQVEMPRWLRAVIKRIAWDNHVSLNTYIVETLKREVKNNGFIISDVNVGVKRKPVSF